VIAVVLMAAIAGWRFVAAAQVDGPVTTDAGNWLAFGRDLLGPDVRSSSIVYPPVVPLLTVVATEVLGLERGIAFLVAVCSVAPAVGVCWTLRRLGVEWIATWAGVVVAFAASSGEAAAWGGFPQLLALGLLPPLLWSLDDHMRGPAPRRAWRSGLIWFAMAATSHFVAAVGALGGLLVVLLHLTAPTGSPDGARRGGSTVRRMRPNGLFGLWPALVVSVPLVPLYLDLATVGSGAVGPGALRTMVDGLRYTSRDVPALWYPAIVVALGAPVAAFDRNRGRSWVLAASASGAAVLALILLADRRVAYLVPVVAMLSVGLLAVGAADRARVRRRRDPSSLLMVALLVVAGVVQIAAGTTDFAGQVEHHAVAAGGVAEVLVSLSGSPSDPVVVVAPARSAPLGWWVEGVSRRRTLTGSDRRWLHFPDERRRAEEAATIFGPGFPTDDQLRTAAAAGASVLVVPSTWRGVDRAALGEQERRGSLVVCAERADVMVLGIALLEGDEAPCR